MITPLQHASFFDWQLRLQEERWMAYAGTRMKDLLAAKKLFAGRIWGIQRSNGMVILRFRHGEEPRMKTLFQLCLAGDIGNIPPNQWEFTYKDYRQSVTPRLSGKNTQVKTQYYLRAEDKQWSFIGVSGFDAGLLDEIDKEYLELQKHPLITLSETDPPAEYLIALRKYVSTEERMIANAISEKFSERSSRVLSGESQKAITISEALKNEGNVIVQGPPGTGKSYLAAEIAAEHLHQGKNVVIGALTNHSLSEIAGQPPLRVPVSQGKVYKTNLSADELKQLDGLKPFTGTLPIQGDLLLITFYQLAVLNEQLSASLPLADLLIIEEASQAFLATISMFLPLGSKVLMIGDHKQLPPVVIDRHEASKIIERPDEIINGFLSLILHAQNHPFLMTGTRRLSSAAAALTSLYYRSPLNSLAARVENDPIAHSCLSLFHPEGGISKALYDLRSINGEPRRVIELCCRAATELLSISANTEVALLTPYVSAETLIYRSFSELSPENPNLLISTIHKVQGITTDYTILILPLDNPSFELDDQLFNVATSRAKRGTLIISPEHIDMVINISTATSAFIKGSKDVSQHFKELLHLIS
ncbi:AAA domain-containing protein [Mucilaginibacter sp. 3215]|uniref:AAA domain-containing protein n=1 Tax=Mucilaginibacter sp. 3215 TaxID=3373912 RepID=UPI003D231156